jgi:uncharacterized protein (TIGR03435 family)
LVGYSRWTLHPELLEAVEMSDHVRVWTIAALASSAFLVGIAGAGAEVTGSSKPLRFEVASIKRNTSGQFGSGPPILPNGEVRFVNARLPAMLAIAYPDLTFPVEVLGLPSWAESDRYDVIAKGKPGATPAEQAEMWRALLADRMKFAAQYETRDKAGYNLVMARPDRRLGPGLTPSTLDCTQSLPAPADPRSAGLTRCNAFGFDRDGTMHAGGVAMSNFATMLTRTAGRPVVDRTGLSGMYAVTMRFQQTAPRPETVPSPDDPPSVFTALQEQLGLKLESATIEARVLVIDHIERPDAD